ncbi:MAG: TerD family protein [Sporichthyaceae bacterium]
MADLGRGARFTLPDLGATTAIEVGIDVSSAENLSFDVCCFGVDAVGDLLADEWLIFFNNPSAPAGAVQSIGPHDGDEQVFRIELAALPADLARLVFTVSLDEGAPTLSAVARGHIRILAGGAPIVRYPYYGADFTTERSVVVGELYRRNGWRFAAVGKGYEGGLATLVEVFGGEIDEASPPVAPPHDSVAASVAAPPEPTPAPAPSNASASIGEPAWVLGACLSGPPVSYKVLSHKDKFFGDRFDPEKVGEAIASYAAMGWEVVGTAIDRQGGDRDSLLVVMVREN